MTTTIWITIGVIFVIVWGFIIFEIYNSPILPEDYSFEEEDLNIGELDSSEKKEYEPMNNGSKYFKS